MDDIVTLEELKYTHCPVLSSANFCFVVSLHPETQKLISFVKKKKPEDIYLDLY